MFLRNAVDGQPKKKPDESQPADNVERPRPGQTEMDRNNGNDEGRESRAEVCTRVEYTGRQRALFFWKPLRDGFDACGEQSGLAQSHRRRHHEESGDGARGHWKEVPEVVQVSKCRTYVTGDRGRDAVRHRGETPKEHSDRECLARPEAIHHSPGENHAERVADLKRGNDVAVVDVIPTEDGL